MNAFDYRRIPTNIYCCATLLYACAASLGAQMVPSARFLDVGSERERVLRVLQITGDVPLYPWSIRGFSPAEWDWLTPRTPNGRALLPPESRQRGVDGVRVEWLPANAGVVYNSAFPFGYNDGPIWAGRGVTGYVSAGVAGRFGPVSFQVEPIVFDASNGRFPLKPNGDAGNPFLDGSYPTAIDLPQRFGNSSYRRFNIGESSLRLDLGPFAAEVSTASQWWGPAIDNPLLLGNNAGGFPHLQLGSAHPIGIGIGTLHARVEWGELSESAFAPTNTVASKRFMSGLVGVFVPRGAPGLEIGAARFFHTPWPDGGLSHAPFGRPFEGILKQQLETPDNPTGTSNDNQLASVFFRWGVPAAGLDVYGEYGREDHNEDLRDFWEEPDHDAGYMLGLQKAWKRSNGRVIAARGEILNTRLSPLQQGRAQAPWYIHTYLTQGHTLAGQALGSIGAFGGGGSTLAIDELTAAGRWTIEWNRIMRGEPTDANGIPTDGRADVLHAFGVERARHFLQSSLVLGAYAVWDLNRDFASDKFSMNISTSIRKAF
jgi:Capsule assembly protein Wzi